MTFRLPAISLWQPWASLSVVNGPRGVPIKRHETRHWQLPRRLVGQRVLIHASQTREGLNSMTPRLVQLAAEVFGQDFRLDLPRGGFVGSVVFSRCYLANLHDTEQADADDVACGNWTPGRWLWAMESAVAFATPIPARGHQSLWTAEVPAWAAGEVA